MVPPFPSGLVDRRRFGVMSLDRRGGTIAKCPAATRSNTRPPHLDAPFAVVDLDAFDRNAADLLRRAGGTPIRLASKSVRCRALIERALDAGLQGILAFTLPEALWLAGHGHDGPRRRLPHGRPRRAARARRRAVRPRDDHGRLPPSTSTWRAAAVREAGGGPIRVCLDVDAGWWPLRRPHPDRRPALAGAHARAGGRARARGARAARSCASTGS